MEEYDHPYFPRELYLPAYVPISRSRFILISLFLAVQVLLLYPIILLVKHYVKDRKFKLWHFAWFTSCAFIHMAFEGYFVYFSKSITSRTDLFGELWKEYALCDSRYMTQDPTVYYIEAVTAFLWGPASFIICLLMMKGSLKYHLWVIAVSLGQLYGSILYLATTISQGSPHSHPHLYYQLFYFYFFNSFWFIIPAYMIYYSYSALIPHFCPAIVVSVKYRPASSLAD